MWQTLVNWLLGIPQMLANISSVFTLTLGDLVKVMPSIPGITTAVELWANVMPNVSLLGFISVTGILVLFAILMVKKIWPFS